MRRDRTGPVGQAARPIRRIQATVVELRDTPQMYASYKDCLSAGDWSSCYRPRDEALAGMAAAAMAHPHFHRLDLSGALCGAAECRASAGDMIIYRDRNHISASFAATLSNDFQKLLPDR